MFTVININKKQKIVYICKMEKTIEFIQKHLQPIIDLEKEGTVPNLL